MESDTPPTTFTYTPLPSPDHFRVLRLQPSPQSDNKLQFSFQTATLHELQDQYEALSYTWGDLVFPHSIQFYDSAEELRITENLQNALLRLRNPYVPRCLWVDALCINQSDPDEKSSQIPLMARIYKSAKIVIVWLGRGVQEEQGIRHLNDISRVNDFANTRQSDDNTGLTSASRTAIQSIFSHPYFKRMWIIQELAANLDVTLYCGTARISWTRFQVAVNRVSNPDSPLHTKSSDVNKYPKIETNSVHGLIRLWKFWAQGEELYEPATKTQDRGKFDANIFALLERFETSLCSDPRDRIYALFNLSTNLEEETSEIRTIEYVSWSGNVPIPISIDYSKTFQEVYEDFARVAIRRGYCTTILEAALARVGHTDLHSRPSTSIPFWVPQWHVPRRPESFESLIKTHGMFPFLQVRERDNGRMSLRTKAYSLPRDKGGDPSFKNKTTQHYSLPKIDKVFGTDSLPILPNGSPADYAKTIFKNSGSKFRWSRKDRHRSFTDPIWNDSLLCNMRDLVDIDEIWPALGFTQDDRAFIDEIVLSLRTLGAGDFEEELSHSSCTRLSCPDTDPAHEHPQPWDPSQFASSMQSFKRSWTPFRTKIFYEQPYARSRASILSSLSISSPKRKYTTFIGLANMCPNIGDEIIVERTTALPGGCVGLLLRRPRQQARSSRPDGLEADEAPGRIVGSCLLMTVSGEHDEKKGTWTPDDRQDNLKECGISLNEFRIGII